MEGNERRMDSYDLMSLEELLSAIARRYQEFDMIHADVKKADATLFADLQGFNDRFKAEAEGFLSRFDRLEATLGGTDFGDRSLMRRVRKVADELDRLAGEGSFDDDPNLAVLSDRLRTDVERFEERVKVERDAGLVSERELFGRVKTEVCVLAGRLQELRKEATGFPF